MKKIIVADNSKTFLMYIGLLLRRLEFNVITVQNGLEVLKLLKLSEADMAILDVNMNTMDGISTLRHIREDKQIPQIPVIMISFESSAETVEICRRLGCFDYLTKPLKVDKLHEVLQKCFFSQQGTNRRHIRIHCIRKALISYNGIEERLYTETLSVGGLYVRRQEPFPVGADVAVTLPLSDQKTLQVRGNVIYTKSLYGDFMTLPPGMAIAFKGLLEEQYQELKDYIEKMIVGDILEEQGEQFIMQ